MEVAGIEPASG